MSFSLLSSCNPSLFQKYINYCSRIEAIIQQDIGKRNIQSLIIPHELAKAGLAFLLSKNIGILTGFPCRIQSIPPTETDGPTGALYLAYASQRLGKDTGIITDISSQIIMEQLITHRQQYPSSTLSSSSSSTTLTPIQLHSFPSSHEWDDKIHTPLLQSLIDKYDHTIAIERSGRSATPPGKLNLQGSETSNIPSKLLLSLSELYHTSKQNSSLYSYRTMKGNDMSHLVAPVDELLIEQTEIYEQLLSTSSSSSSTTTTTTTTNDSLSTSNPIDQQITIPSKFHSILQHKYPRTSTGIGDGGNECGMGKVYNQVYEHIPYGTFIASIIPCDNLLTCGVSHWGSYGILGAIEGILRYNLIPLSSIPTSIDINSSSSSLLYTLYSQPSNLSSTNTLLPSDDEENYFTGIMNQYGAGDGINNSFDKMIDGLDLSVHLNILHKIQEIIKDEFGK